jgi:hypothetical protein
MTYGGEDGCIRRGHSVDLAVDGMTIIDWILNKKD